MIEFRVYKNGAFTKATTAKVKNRPAINVSNGDIYSIIRKDETDFWFKDMTSRHDVTGEKLLWILNRMDNCKDVDLMERIILHGGLSEYALKLEKELGYVY